MLERLKSGERLRNLPSREWNTFCDVAERFLGNGPPEELLGAIGLDAVRIQVANMHEEPLPALAAVGLGNPIVMPTTSEFRFRELPVIKCYQCLASSYRFKTAVLLQELGENQVGEAAIGGILPLKISVGHASHLFVTAPESAGNKFETSWWGTGRILWKESGTGDKWALVALGEYWAHTLLGKAGSNITKGASGSVTIWPDSGGESSESEVTAMARGAAITAAKYVQLVWPYNSDMPVVGPYECG